MARMNIYHVGIGINIFALHPAHPSTTFLFAAADRPWLLPACDDINASLPPLNYLHTS